MKREYWMSDAGFDSGNSAESHRTPFQILSETMGTPLVVFMVILHIIGGITVVSPIIQSLACQMHHDANCQPNSANSGK